MLSPITIVLVKIFAKGFYRIHSGLLLFFVVSVSIYFFFIQVLNQTHLPPDEVMHYNLILVLTIVSSPIAVSLVSISWLAFTFKSCDYILGQVLISSNQFLFYSITSTSKVNQFRSWFFVQLAISLPMVGYGLFCLVIGLVFGYYIFPVVLLLYIAVLSAISAIVYLRFINSLTRTSSYSIFLRIVHYWKKPFFSLFLYHVLSRLKISFVATKLLSVAIMTGGFYLMNEVDEDLIVASIMILGIATAHALLIYQSYRFENSHLAFSRNLPYSRVTIYYNWALTYLLFTLPENILVLTRFEPEVSVAVLVLNLGTGMLFRNLLYVVTPNMKTFIYWIFYLFTLFFIMILFRLVLVLAPLSVIISFMILYRNYYEQKAFIKV